MIPTSKVEQLSHNGTSIQYRCQLEDRVFHGSPEELVIVLAGIQEELISIRDLIDSGNVESFVHLSKKDNHFHLTELKPWNDADNTHATYDLSLYDTPISFGVCWSIPHSVFLSGSSKMKSIEKINVLIFQCETIIKDLQAIQKSQPKNVNAKKKSLLSRLFS